MDNIWKEYFAFFLDQLNKEELVELVNLHRLMVKYFLDYQVMGFEDFKDMLGKRLALTSAMLGEIAIELGMESNDEFLNRLKKEAIDRLK